MRICATSSGVYGVLSGLVGSVFGGRPRLRFGCLAFVMLYSLCPFDMLFGLISYLYVLMPFWGICTQEF